MPDASKFLLDAETTYNDYKQMHEKLPETFNMLETIKFIVETHEKGVQIEVLTCDKAVQIDKGRNDCIILPILSIVYYILEIIIAICILHK